MRVINQIALLLLVVAAATSCKYLDPAEPIPSYIQVDSYQVVCDVATQGSANQDMHDIWVVHNGKEVAAVPIPCTVPVLQEKGNQVTLYPGIKENATSTNRSIFPFFEPIVVDIDFEPGKIYRFTAEQMVFKYKPNVNFLWIEGFENETISLTPINGKSAPYQRIKNPDKVLEGEASLQVLLKENDSMMALEAFNFIKGKEFNLGSPAFLEFNYNVQTTIQVGFGFRSADGYIARDQPYLYLRETKGEWKKVYVKLTDQVALLDDEAGIKPYFLALLPKDQTSVEILIDNIKLITFE
ncbi:hypothetical protein GC194_05515 [bacterium]|nr:hypothetical protein [bacterium]